MRILCFLAIVFLPFIICAQTNSGVLEENRTCDCEVLLVAIDFPSDDEPGPDPNDLSVYARGDLSNFISYSNGECFRSVRVYKRVIESAVFRFQEDYMVNDVNTLLDRYRLRTSICFRGRFNAFETINLRNGNVIKLIDETSITYRGNDDGPVFDILGNNNAIDGGGLGEIITDTNMPNGAIRLASEGLALDGNNVNYNHIKNVAIISNATNNNGDPSSDNGNSNQGIFLSNTPESIYEHSDNGSVYYTNISNVDISGFSTGLRARGWSNAVLIRDIRMSDISSYGIWVSGCIDNSFANIQYENCPNASAIRLDSYVDERFSNFEVAGTQFSLNDPNERIAIDLINPLNALFNAAALDNLQLTDELRSDNPDGYIGTDLLGYNMIKEACGVRGKADYANEINLQSNQLLKFGLLGYEEDATANYINFMNDDEVDVFQAHGLTQNPEPRT